MEYSKDWHMMGKTPVLVMVTGGHILWKVRERRKRIQRLKGNAVSFKKRDDLLGKKKKIKSQITTSHDS